MENSPPQQSRKNAFLPVLLLLAAAALLYFAYLGVPDYIDRDESRRARVVQVMFETGDFIVPRLSVDGPLYVSKPVQWYWHAAAVCRIAGGKVTEWTTRMPSAIAATAILFLVYAWGAGVMGWRGGLLAALLLAAAPGFLLQARMSTLDMTLAGFETAALFCFWKGYRGEWGRGAAFSLFWWFCGCAFATKFAVALLAPLGGVCVFLLLQKQLSMFWNWSTFRQAAWFLPVGLCWYVLIYLKLDDPWGVVVHEVVKPAANTYAHKKDFFYFLYMFPAAVFPATFFLVQAIVCWRSWGRGHAAARRFLACVLLPSFLAFSVFSSKQHYYVLPLYPWAALLAALFVDEFVRESAAKNLRAGYCLTWALLVCALGYISYEARHYPLPQWTWGVAFACGILIPAIGLLRPSGRFFAMTAGHVAAVAALCVLVYPRYARWTTVKPIVTAVRECPQELEAVYIHEVNDWKLQNYIDAKVKGLLTEQERSEQEVRAHDRGTLPREKRLNTRTFEELLAGRGLFLIICDRKKYETLSYPQLKVVGVFEHVDFGFFDGLQDVVLLRPEWMPETTAAQGS